MEHRVQRENFYGPLDLLLYLIKEKLNRVPCIIYKLLLLTILISIILVILLCEEFSIKTKNLCEIPINRRGHYHPFEDEPCIKSPLRANILIRLDY